jgi:hypothetical protein
VAVDNESNQSYRFTLSRSTSRLNSRVPIALEWTDERGGQFHAEGRTLDVSPKGCLAIFHQKFAVGRRLRVRNLVNQKAVEAVVAWNGHEGRGGWELGIELIEPPQNFWELEL